MKELESICVCGSGKRFEDCCYKTSSIVDLDYRNIDQAERGLKMKLVAFSSRPDIQAQIGEAFYIWMNAPELPAEYMDEDDDIDDLTFTRFIDWFIYDFKLINVGKRLIERFYEEERQNLTEIESSILDDWMNNLHSFFEVEEVIPEEGCHIRDIFTGEVFQIKDSATSLQTRRSDIIGGRPLKVKNNSYFSGVVSIYSQALKPIIIDFVNRELKEYRMTFGKKRTTKEYLKDWGYLIVHYIENISKRPHFLTPEGNEYVSASSTYSVNNYDKALKRLRTIKSFEEIQGGTNEFRAFSWIRKRKGSEEGILGTIEVEKSELTIKCCSSNLLAKAKRLIDDNLSDIIVHKEDSTKQLESFQDRQSRENAKGGRLPYGLKNQSQLDSILNEYYEVWIDKPLAALGNKTPREALETGQGREKLDLILKELQSVYDGAQQRGEPYYNTKNLRKKLRLE